MRALNRWKAACACAIVALALLVCLFAVPARAETDGMLRVKLTRLGTPEALRLVADCDYYLASDPSVRVSAGTEMTLSARGGVLTLSAQGRSVPLGDSAQLMRSVPGSSGVTFLSPALSNRFCGDLVLSASGDAITAVLRIHVEDYLYGVVGYEMAPSSGIEALKAQAVAARNCALTQKAARSAAAYDLSDAGDSLSFRGYNSSAEYANALRAVDETRGQTLYYGEEPALCYFCESNGGQTESSRNAFGVSLPYSDVRDDPYDFDGSGPRRTATLRRDAAGLEPGLETALLGGMAEQLERLELSADPADVRITSIDDIVLRSPRFDAPSRLYAAAAFQLTVASRTALGQTGTARVTVSVPTYGGIEQWYGLSLNDGDNETVWLSSTARAFEITFRRSGSGVGMSQRGAQAMALQGFSCEDILGYYYPGATLRELYLPDATRDEANPRASASLPSEPIATARLSQKSRLYESAGADAAALTTLPAGATVSVYAVQGEWAAVGSGGLNGFVHAEALASFELAGVTAAQVLDEALAQVSAGPVEVLQLPVSTASAVATLSGGDTVRLNAYTDQWALITTASGTEGYVPRGALTLQAGDADASGGVVTAPEETYCLLTEDAGLYVNADDSIPPRQTLTAGGYVQLLAYNRAWALVRTADGLSGYVKQSSLSALRQAPAQGEAEGEIEGGPITKVQGEAYRYVAEDALPLYESYSTASPVLAALEKGQRVRLGAYNGTWACVRADGATGFVLLSGLTDAPPEADDGAIEGGPITRIKDERYAVVTQDGAPLYPSWSEGDAPLMLLNAGERVRLGAYNAAWACVRAGNVTGFVRVDALDMN